MTINVERKKVKVLSFGGGQDSTELLAEIAKDPAFRERELTGAVFVAVMSDTGNEHPETIAHVAYVKDFCLEHEIEFHHLTPEDGFHTETWHDLKDYLRENEAIVSKAGFKKTCSVNLKQRPIYRWLEVWIGEEFGYLHAEKLASGRWSKKTALQAFARDHGRIEVWIGFTKGEERRFAGYKKVSATGYQPKPTKEGKSPWDPWMMESIELRFPLVEMGLDRKGCQRRIAELGVRVPVPSNCMLCPFLSDAEIVLLERTHPEEWADWVAFEKAKISAWAVKGQAPAKNYGVHGLKPLEKKLKEAKTAFGHLSTEELQAYRFDHASCASQY